MNHDAKNLLVEVMAEDAPADLREAMLGGALREARRRRHRRQALQFAPVLIALSLIALLVRHPANHRPVSKEIVRDESPYRLVRTEPLSIEQIVTTQSLAAPEFHTVPLAVDAVQITTTKGGYHLIGDDDLLGMFKECPVMLVRLDDRSERLVFLHPECERGFPIN